jgi:hypothetical protein
MMRVLPGASLWCVALRALQTVNNPRYCFPHSLQTAEKIRQFSGSAQPSSKVVLPPGIILPTPPAKPHCSLQTRPQCARFHHSTLCENALAVSFAGVVHQLHPLAGIDSARLLLSSGDAISYVSNCRAQSDPLTLNCLAMFRCSTASLLSPCPGWPASAA